MAAVGAHLVSAVRADAWTATAGEARLAVAAAVARGAGVVADPLTLTDRFAALQLALVETLLPTGGVPVVDAARWACLVFGLAAALLVWPILRGLRVSPAAAAAGVALAGVSLPALALHSGISAAAPAAAWLAAGAALAVHEHGRVAAGAVVVAALTAPLAGAVALALVAHLVLLGEVGRVRRYRVPVGVAVAVTALVVTVVSGAQAGTGPEVSTPIAVAGAVVGALLVLLAARVAAWLRPAVPGTLLLLAVAVLPGPSRATAALLAIPALAVALAVVAEQLTARVPGRTPLAVLLVVLVGPTVAAPALLPAAPARDPGLLTWLADTPAVIRADALDRVELLAAGVPAGRLREPADPSADGALVLVTDRPGAATTPCAAGSVVAVAARGTGGAPARVCRTDVDGATVAAEQPARSRLGAALAGNPSLALAGPAAAALRAGSVDPRLMLVLAAMTTAHRLAVADFPVVAHDAPGLPRRRAVLTGVDGTDPASSELLRAWLSGQQPPFVPTLVVPSGPDLVVGYPSPPPGGLLPR